MTAPLNCTCTEPEPARRTYRLPPTFYEDHTARDLPAGNVVRETKQHVYVSLDAAEFAELLSDASHYSTPGMYGPEYLGLVSSARATVRALVAAGQPEDES